MSTLPVHIQACQPSLADPCVYCGGNRYAFPLMGLLATGVVPAGSLTLCPDCDTPKHAVREHIVRLADEGWDV